MKSGLLTDRLLSGTTDGIETERRCHPMPSEKQEARDRIGQRSHTNQIEEIEETNRILDNDRCHTSVTLLLA